MIVSKPSPWQLSRLLVILEFIEKDILNLNFSGLKSGSESELESESESESKPESESESELKLESELNFFKIS